jgi:hypothetical protein
MLALLLMISGCATSPEIHPKDRSSIGGSHLARLPDRPENGTVVISRFSFKNLYSGERVLGSVFPGPLDKAGVEAPARKYLGYVTREGPESSRAYRFVTIHWEAQIIMEPSDQDSPWLGEDPEFQDRLERVAGVVDHGR